jgi:hypothetical protein
MQEHHLTVNNQPLNLTAIQNLLRQDLKLQAIQQVKEQTGLGLKESKELVEHIQIGSYKKYLQQLEKGGGISATNSKRANQARNFNVVKRSTNSSRTLTLVLLVLVVAFLVYYYADGM